MMTIFPLQPLTRPIDFVRVRGPRLARFACTGVAAGIVQLALLHLWTERGWDALVANPVAFLISAQLNFLLSATFIWGDRQDGMRRTATLVRRWLAFHGSILGTTLINQVVFAVAQTALPPLVAAGTGIAAAALLNFLVQDRLVFARNAIS
jgi:putative flippase GtrA